LDRKVFKPLRSHLYAVTAKIEDPLCIEVERGNFTAYHYAGSNGNVKEPSESRHEGCQGRKNEGIVDFGIVMHSSTIG
jgi:hypothetical protein